MKISFPWTLLIILFSVGLMLSGIITYTFAVLGLHEAEKQFPHQFDGHKYVNYKFFHDVLNVTPVFLLCSVVTIVALWVLRQPDDS